MCCAPSSTTVAGAFHAAVHGFDVERPAERPGLDADRSEAPRTLRVDVA